MFHESVFIASGAKVVGDVSCGESSSIWYNAVVRADRRKIEIGKFSNVQDNCVVHAEKHDLVLGDYVSVGHGAIIHGCRITGDCIVGMGAVVMEGAVIEECCIVGAGAVVTENKVIPRNSLVLGVPGKVVRELTEEEVKHIRVNALDYVELAKKNRLYKL